jgi:iron complex transport system ATP-binding protein
MVEMMDGNAPDVLRCSRVCVRVPGRALVEDLDLEVRAGAVLAVLGRNGAGKSSTLHTLAGLRPAAGGNITLGARPLDAWPRREIARRVGLLPQVSEDPFPATALEAVLVGRHPHLDFWQWESARDVEIARRCLATVDLAAFDAREVATLSGGERRRLAAATVLAQEPQTYLLDEPIQQLDPQHQLDVLAIFRRLADAGRAVALILHDVGLAARFADDVLLLFGDGRWQHGPATAVLNERSIGELYGMPVRELRWPGGRTFVPAAAPAGG